MVIYIMMGGGWGGGGGAKIDGFLRFNGFFCEVLRFIVGGVGGRL